MIVVGVTLGNDLPNAFDLVYEVDHWASPRCCLKLMLAPIRGANLQVGVGPPKPSGGGVRVSCPSRRGTL